MRPWLNATDNGIVGQIRPNTQTASMRPWLNATDNALDPTYGRSRRRASMRPWLNATDNPTCTRPSPPRRPGFNEAVAQRHGQLSSVTARPSQPQPCFNEAVAQRHGQRAARSTF